MNDIQILGLVSAFIKNVPVGKRIPALKDMERSIPEESMSIFHAAIDIVTAGIVDDPQSIVVVLVHGIRTDAAWQTRLRFELKDERSINVIPLGYGFFNALNFWGPFRKGPVAKIGQELRDIRHSDPKARIVIVAHSFGTYIVSKLMATISDLCVERIILCGSVVSCNFRWDSCSVNVNRQTVLNDVGTEDHYPVLATCATLGYGSSGRLGFQNGRVTDRFFNYGHSDFLTPEHMSKYWKPFILKGEIVVSDWDLMRKSTPYWIMLLSRGPWIPIFVIASLVGLIYYLI